MDRTNVTDGRGQWTLLGDWKQGDSEIYLDIIIVYLK